MALALFAAGAVTADTGPTITGLADVIDGDGLKIGPVAIRLHGIDAPEAGQTCPRAGGGTWSCGKDAAQLLDDLAGGREVVCTALDGDPYGRIVASCAVGGRDVATGIMRAGLAWAYVEYSDDYVAIEAEAKAAGLGVWQAAAEAPWDYRADRWGRAVEASPSGCPIKGNISASGERIYHTPWSPYYGRTQISEAQGERWFCDEAAAQAAGWRSAESR
ncbi:thermonuclease family protein [uncultured Jannaschia sp.]|uniref:thermonuclease family protein n=1 Tax=uncultured Jannaschia sp. TaxID=293347 RepID=UPI0026068FCE|nr:thermonuclease family protein [uncultured Jannaschia sp.]